jgi:hypothetical protein
VCYVVDKKVLSVLTFFLLSFDLYMFVLFYKVFVI